MPERFVGLMATLALAIGQPTEINRMLIGADLHGSCRISRIVNYSVTDIAIAATDLARVAHVLAVMTTKTATEIKMSDVVRMSLPIGPHFGEEIGSKDSLELVRRGFDVVTSFRENIRI